MLVRYIYFAMDMATRIEGTPRSTRANSFRNQFAMGVVMSLLFAPFIVAALVICLLTADVEKRFIAIVIFVLFYVPLIVRAGLRIKKFD